MDLREFIGELARLPGTVTSDTVIMCVEENYSGQSAYMLPYEIVRCYKQEGSIWLEIQSRPTRPVAA